MSDCDCEVEAKNEEQKRVLVWLLAINGAMFVVELVLGLLAQSTGLIADSLDMLADATVYAIGLWAVGRAVSAKARAALTSGVAQIALALFVGGDVARRAVTGSEPVSWLMIGVGLVALVANVICLTLIAKHRDGEVHMRASWIFSKNDVLANLGVVASGVLVMVLESRIPDLVIGAAIAFLVMRGGIHIVKDARGELAARPS